MSGPNEANEVSRDPIVPDQQQKESDQKETDRSNSSTVEDRDSSEGFRKAFGRRFESIVYVQNLQFIRQLGNGLYGEIYEVNVDGTHYAGKKFHTKVDREDFIKECQIHSQLHHENILKFVGIHFRVNHSVLLITELMSMDLYKYRTQYPSLPLSFNLSILCDVAEGMNYLHSRKPTVVHGDLSPRHILLTDNLHAKISGFGFANCINEPMSIGPVGHISYMAPEIMTQHCTAFDEKADIWSFGIVSLFLTVHVQDSKTSMVQNCFYDELEFDNDIINDLMAVSSTQLYELVKNCLQHTSSERPRAEELSRKLRNLCLRFPSKLEDLLKIKAENDSVSTIVAQYLKDEKKHLDAVEEIMKTKGELDQTIVQCVFVGPPRNGKSSLMRRLVGQKPIDLQTLSSTGVAERVLQVKIEQISSSTVEIGKGSLSNPSSLVWSELSFDDEVLRLLIDISGNPNSQQLAEDSFIDLQTESVLKDTDKKASSLKLPTNVENYTAAEHTITSQKQTTSDRHCTPTDAVLTPVQGSLFSSNFKSTLEIFKEALRNKNWLGAKKYLEGACIAYLTDTGGQIEFQELLSALVSGPSIFFLVFRLDQDLNERLTVEYVHSTGSTSKPYQSSFTAKEALLQSLASIASMGTCIYKKGLSSELQPLRPKVFFIGTHRDLVSQERIQEIDSELQKVVRVTEHYKEGLIQFASESPCRMLLAVNNLSPSDCEFDCVRMAVQRVISRGDFNIRAPPQWLIFSLVIRQMHNQRVLTYDECFKIARQCGINSKEEVNEALWFLSTKVGLIRHFQGKDLEDLHEIVIRDPQILFDRITDLVVETFTFEKTDPVVHEDFQKKGIFPISVLETVSGKGKDSLLTTSKLVQILQHLHIIAQISKEGEAVKIFMPCILSHADSVKVQADEKHQVPPLLVAFRCGYCPKGLFAALIAYLLNKMKSKYEWELDQEEMFMNLISFRVGPYADTVSLRFNLTFIEINFVPSTFKSTRKFGFEVCCKEVRECFEKSLQTVTLDLQYTHDAKYFLGFYCSEFHPAKIRFLEEEPCSLTCEHCNCIIDLPCGHDVWFSQPLQQPHPQQPHPQQPCPQQLALQRPHPQQSQPQQLVLQHPHPQQPHPQQPHPQQPYPQQPCPQQPHPQQPYPQQPHPQQPYPQQPPLQQSHPQQLHPQQLFSLHQQQLQQKQDEVPLTPHSFPSMENWQHQIMSKKSSAIIRALAANCLANPLADELKSRRMIGATVYQQATNYGPNITEYTRVQHLIISMLSKIEYNPQRYHDFIEVLQLDGICEDAEAALSLLPKNPPQ